LLADHPGAEWHARSGMIVLRRVPTEPSRTVLVLCAGTSDLPVAEEAAVTAEAFGCCVDLVADVGIAELTAGGGGCGRRTRSSGPMREHAGMGYRGKLAEREQARLLRADGLPLAEIAARLEVSKSSVSLWVRDVDFEPRPRAARARRRQPNALQRRKQAEIDRLRAEAGARVGRLSEREFLVAGAALYAGEGAKGDGAVVFANSDPRMIAFFCAWLRHFFTIDESRLRVRLYLHQGLDLVVATTYWSQVTGIPEAQFLSPYRAAPDPSIRHAKHVHGCAGVRYSCTATHRSIMGLVGALLSDVAIPG
jgi:hypothetical protein